MTPRVRGGLEVPDEWGARLDRDDGAAVLPDAVEQLAEELAALGRVVLDLPEAGEVFEQRFGLGDVGVCWRADSLDLLLQHLAAHDVLVSREVAHDVGAAVDAAIAGDTVRACLIAPAIALLWVVQLPLDLRSLRINLDVAAANQGIGIHQE